MDFREETVADMRRDGPPLFERHWHELAEDKRLRQLNPAWTVYEAAEKRGLLVVVTARDQGRLVGYFVCGIGTSNHYSGLRVALEDLYYIIPEYRRFGHGSGLFRTMEEALKKRSVQISLVKEKESHDNEDFLEKQGYRPYERTYCKVLGD